MKRREESQGTVVQPLVLVVDDDPSVCEALSSLLAPRLEPFYRVETASFRRPSPSSSRTSGCRAAPEPTS